MKCPECTFDETTGRCVECGAFRPVSNNWIEVPCQFCPPVKAEEIAAGAFSQGDTFDSNTPTTQQIAARFLFEIGAFSYVVIQCPGCQRTQAVFNIGAGGFALGVPPETGANAAVDELRDKYEKYEAFITYNPRLLREFTVFCEQGIYNAKLHGLGPIQKRIQSGTFQLKPGYMRSNYMGTGDPRSPLIAATEFLKDKIEERKEVPVAPFDTSWKGLFRRVWQETRAFRLRRKNQDIEK